MLMTDYSFSIWKRYGEIVSLRGHEGFGLKSYLKFLPVILFQTCQYQSIVY
jgi:hypothetical protein